MRPVPRRRIAAGAVAASFFAAWQAIAPASVPAVTDASEFLPLDFGSRFLGGFVADDGDAWLGLRKGEGQEETGTLLSWSGGEIRSWTLDPNLVRFRYLYPLARGGFVLLGLSVPNSKSNHGDFVHQVYSLSSDEPELRWSKKAWDVATITLSGDGRVWGAMAGHGMGRHFAFGSMKSPKIERRRSLAFSEPARTEGVIFAGGDTSFLFLDSDRPVVLAPYANQVYLLQFGDFGVDSRPVDQLKSMRDHPIAQFVAVWQPEDRVLWTQADNDWSAWDLWDLGLSDFPEEPFQRHAVTEGWPHWQRGFVKAGREDGRYRVEHLWQSPSFPEWKERHVSEWQQGDPVGYGMSFGYGFARPVQATVSPNGRHGIAIEQRQDAEGVTRRFVRRFELHSVPEIGAQPEPSEKDGRRR